MDIFSFSPFGYEGALVNVEVDIRRGIPSVDLVGLADNAVKESRERMKSAIRNSGFSFPAERVLISLSPADLKKEGAGFDLPLALAVLSADAGGAEPICEPVLVMGELELSGAIRAVKAVHAAAATALGAGISKCIVPQANAAEAREVSGMGVFGAAHLGEAFNALFHPELFTSRADEREQSFVPENCVTVGNVLFPPIDPSLDFKNVVGQKKLVRALQIAASGSHNVIAFGPPGCGKTLSLQRFMSILPLLTVEEAQSTTRIHSIAGLLPATSPLLRVPVMRMPHQTASVEGICGGGVQCRPGEISLAHNGVLFLDEAAEFRSSVLQMLRVPLESGAISLSRAGRTTTYPASFQLLLATNPCPCGNYGSEGKLCLCSAKAVDMYWRKFSGPLLDRIDIRLDAGASGGETGGGGDVGVSSAELRVQVADAVFIQRNRQGKRNAHLSPQELLEFCPLGNEEQAFLDSVAGTSDLSQRALSGILKLSRTIADMEKSAKICVRHMQEAVELRKNVGPLALFSA